MEAIRTSLRVVHDSGLNCGTPVRMCSNGCCHCTSPGCSVFSVPLSRGSCRVVGRTIRVLGRLRSFSRFSRVTSIIKELRSGLSVDEDGEGPVVRFSVVPGLGKLRLLGPLCGCVTGGRALEVVCRSFGTGRTGRCVLCPCLLGRCEGE